MAFLAEIYSIDEGFLAELAGELDQLAEAAEPPAPVEAPGALDLDIVTLGGQLWELVVAFGSIKASLETVQLIGRILRRRKDAGVETEVEVALPNGVRVTLSGKMTADEAAARVEEFRQVLGAPPTVEP